MKQTLIVLKDTYTICKFKPNTDISRWIKNSEFYSVTESEDELSVVCRQSSLAGDMLGFNKDWRVLKISGPLDFSLTGIISDISGILKKKNIPILTISSYDTDYILVKSKDLNKSIEALIFDGNIIISDNV